jgi:hypothetical protein
MACCCAPAVETQSEAVPTDKPAATPAAPQEQKSAFEVSVTKEAEGSQAKIGLDITHWPDQKGGKALKIKNVKEGLIKSYNDEAAKTGKPVVKDDMLITAVNGKKGNSQDILAEISRAKELKLTIEPIGQ